MSATVSTRWFWSDWMSDPSLRACSYAARGFWKDLLCIAGSNKKEYGFVSLNGRKLSDADLAKMTNGTESEVVSLIEELELNGVFSRDRRGVIYCRRMVRSEKNRINGRLGGNPKLLNKKENQESVIHEPKPLIPEPEPEPKPELEKTRVAALEKMPPEVASDWPQDYVEQFWGNFPPYRRQSKTKVAAKLSRIRSERKVPWEVLFGAVMKFSATNPGEFAPAPMVWLNDGRWDREYGSCENGGSNGKTTHTLGGFSGLAAQLRRKIAEEEFRFGEDTGGQEPLHRR
jgi:hypothetical protein